MNLEFITQFFQDYTIYFFIYVAITVIISFILIKSFSFLINKISKKFEAEATLNYLLKDIIKYLIYIAAFIIILNLAGIDITGLVVSLGIVGISIGFAARDIISSFVSGMFILADKTVKVGEIIEVGTIKGKVKKLGLRSTTLITADNMIVTVPNSVLARTPYINHTFFDNYRIDLTATIPMNIDLNKFKTVFIKKISNLEWVLDDSPPRVVVGEIIDNGVKLRISAWGQNYSKIEDYRIDLADELRIIINEYGNELKLN